LYFPSEVKTSQKYLTEVFQLQFSKDAYLNSQMDSLKPKAMVTCEIKLV